MFANFVPVVDSWAWRGRSGAVYRHYVYAIGSMPAARSAVFVLAHLDDQGRYHPLYVGEFGGAERVGAPRLSRALLSGATHVHFNFQGSTDDERHAIAEDLREALTPQSVEVRSAV